jgi:hypothetical protein
MTNIPEKAKGVAATGLTTVAKVLRMGADTVGGVAALLQPGADRSEHPDRPEEAVEEAQQEGDRSKGSGPAIETRGEVKEPTTVDVPDVTHASKPRSHAAEHAQGTVADVVARIPELSTDELRLLIEHESVTKKRKGVLDAVEQALAP